MFRCSLSRLTERILTIEGLATTDGLHPLQQAVHRLAAVSSARLHARDDHAGEIPLDENPDPTADQSGIT